MPSSNNSIHPVQNEDENDHRDATNVEGNGDDEELSLTDSEKKLFEKFKKKMEK